MVFSSLHFLYFFLPLVLCAALLFELKHLRSFRNILLVALSLAFYSWGEGYYVALMLFSIALNHTFGKFVSQQRSPVFLFFGIAANLLLLLYYKYFSFVASEIFGFTITDSPHLPLGISFFTFQALSYLIDCYRKVSAPQTSVIGTALYISLFPQLIAGPIVRYHSIAKQIQDRRITFPHFEYGIRRFIWGLAKKVLLANPLAEFVDYAFALPAEALTPTIAWLGALSYALQIYYDFSGYSDMAIGLGAMLGFTFPENFRAPYAARSIREFWQKWHITLSEWFRDYLYIPLGGSRVSDLKVIRNLFTVFILCGLWHGAAWTFLLWGLWHGLFLSLERTRFGKTLLAAPHFVQHLYLMGVVLLGWVLFRSNSLSSATTFYSALFGLHSGIADSFYFLRLNNQFTFTLILGSLLATLQLTPKMYTERNWSRDLFQLFATLLILTLTTSQLVGGAHNPFIYFRF